MVDAATIVHDSMAHLLETLDEAEQKEFFGRNDFPTSSWNVCDAERCGRDHKISEFYDFRRIKYDFCRDLLERV